MRCVLSLTRSTRQQERRGRPRAPRQAVPAEAFRRAAAAASFRASRRGGHAARRVAVRSAGRRQDHARRELSRGAPPAPSLVPMRRGGRRQCDVPALPSHRRAAARGQGGGGLAAIHVGAPAGPRQVRSQLLPRSLLRIAIAVRGRVRQPPRSRCDAPAARGLRAGSGGSSRANNGHRDLARRSAARVRAPCRERAHRAHRRSRATLHGG